MTAKTLVTGVFNSADQASAAIAGLISRGISRDDINVLAAEDTKLETFGIQKQSKLAEGAAVGAGFGGAAGALLAGFTAVGALATGGVGIIAAGPIVAALAGAGAGAATGGVVGGLIGLGIPEHKVDFYKDALNRGSVLVGVTVPDTDKGDAEQIMRQNGAESVTSESVSSRTRGAIKGRDTDAATNGAKNGLRELFLHQLKDIYYAEKQILGALPGMRDKAKTPELAQAFDHHLAETRGHVQRLEHVFRAAGVEPREEKCPAINGILSEAKDLMKLDDTPAELDAAMICAAQKVEHYEMATYGCLKSYAEQLGLGEAVSLLGQTLDEEKAADEKLTTIAESVVNSAASEQIA